MNKNKVRVLTNPYVQGMAISLLSVAPLVAFAVSTIRRDLFSFNLLSEVSLAFVWLSGLLLLLIDRLVEFDMDLLKGKLSGKLSDSGAVSIEEAISQQEGEPR